MGRTLDWLDALLAKARQRFEMQRHNDCVRLLHGLVATSACDDDARELFVESCLELGRYKDARRVLRSLVAANPRVAKHQFLLARAIECDPAADAAKAMKHYRRALDLEPANIECLLDGAEYAVSMGYEKEGFIWLRRAHALEPRNLDVLRAYVGALCDLEQYDDARSILAGVRFTLGGSPEYRKIVADCEFQALRASQAEVVEARSKPVVLPFLRATSDDKPVKRRWRVDSGSKSRPHFPRLIRRFDARHAP